MPSVSRAVQLQQPPDSPRLGSHWLLVQARHCRRYACVLYIIHPATVALINQLQAVLLLPAPNTLWVCHVASFLYNCGSAMVNKKRSLKSHFVTYLTKHTAAHRLDCQKCWASLKKKLHCAICRIQICGTLPCADAAGDHIHCLSQGTTCHCGGHHHSCRPYPCRAGSSVM